MEDIPSVDLVRWEQLRRSSRIERNCDTETAQVEELPEAQITVYTRLDKAHIITLNCVLILSFVSYFCTVILKGKFFPNCYMYPNITDMKINHSSNDSTFLLKDEPRKIRHFGRSEWCELAIYVPFFSMILAALMILVFIIEKNYRNENSYLPVKAFFGFVTSSTTLCMGIVLEIGTKSLCDLFLGRDVQVCNWTQFMDWMNLPLIHDFYYYLKTAKIAIWMSTVAWFIECFLSLFAWIVGRCFQLDEVIEEENEVNESEITEVLRSIKENIQIVKTEEEANI